MLRVISGDAKGRRLKVPAGNQIRPTSDKVRESLFNIIGPENTADSVFLDLFAGSGAVGIEAISRGAGFVTLVDDNVRHIKTIKDNIKTCGFHKSCEVICGDVIAFLDRSAKGGRSYNIIFADPPYNYNNWPALLSKIINNVKISGYGFIILEHSSKVSIPEQLSDLEEYGRYVYGDTTLTVYRKHGNNGNLSGDI